MPRIAQSVAMGIGAAGALVDVTSDVNMDDGISRSWGRDDEFRDTSPGTFSFTLDNGPGKYTPGNTAGGLSTLVTEGMQVCWQLGTRLVAGTIRGIEPVFPSDESAWAQVRITCDDMLGSAARHQLTNLTLDAINGSTAYMVWPMSDAAGSWSAAEVSGNGQPAMVPYNEAFLSGALQITGLTPTFGVAAVPAVGATQANMVALAGSSANTFGTGPGANPDLTTNRPFKTITYPTNNFGCWSVWVTPTNATTTAFMYVGPPNFMNFSIAPAGFYTATVFGTDIVSTVQCAPNTPHLLQLTLINSGGSRLASFYVDGVLVGTKTAAGVYTNVTAQPGSVRFSVGAATGDSSLNVSMVAHTSSMPTLADAGATTEVARLALLARTTPEISIPSYPTDLSTAPLGIANTTGSTLDALNDLVRTEQGYLYTATTGTLLAPSQGLVMRARTRSPNVDYTFDTTLDLASAISYVRDVTNMVSTLTVSGPSVTVVLQDPSTIARVGSASTAETILNNSPTDLVAWGQDRLNRGKNAALRVSSVTVDAMTTTTDRSAALLAMLPGDHIQTTSNPTTQLGFAAWDGLLIGGDEHHSTTEHTFAMRLAPVQAATAIYDTNRYMSGGELSLSASLTNVATSMSVATTGATITVAGGDFPFNMIIDSEVVTVTACTSATPQVATITRAAAGTVAAAHSSSALVEVATPALYAF